MVVSKWGEHNQQIMASQMAKIQVVALNLFLVCIYYSSLPMLHTTYRRLAPSWSIRSESEPSDLTHITYAQSHNRTLNRKRRIESSVSRLFSGDSCIFVPRVNFTNKAPPIIKTLTNFRLSHIFHLSHSHPSSAVQPSTSHHITIFNTPWRPDPSSHHPDGHFSADKHIISSAPPSFHQRPRP
jgi:hypothetical protein